MPQALRKYTFKGSGVARYPWPRWFDGKIRRINATDFAPSTPESFRMTALQAAWRKGVKLRTRIDGACVVLQAQGRRA